MFWIGLAFVLGFEFCFGWVNFSWLGFVFDFLWGGLVWFAGCNCGFEVSWGVGIIQQFATCGDFGLRFKFVGCSIFGYLSLVFYLLVVYARVCVYLCFFMLWIFCDEMMVVFCDCLTFLVCLTCFYLFVVTLWLLFLLDFIFVYRYFGCVEFFWMLFEFCVLLCLLGCSGCFVFTRLLFLWLWLYWGSY